MFYLAAVLMVLKKPHKSTQHYDVLTMVYNAQILSSSLGFSLSGHTRINTKKHHVSEAGSASIFM